MLSLLTSDEIPRRSSYRSEVVRAENGQSFLLYFWAFWWRNKNLGTYTFLDADFIQPLHVQISSKSNERKGCEGFLIRRGGLSHDLFFQSRKIWYLDILNFFFYLIVSLTFVNIIVRWFFYLSHLIILRKQVNTETWIFWEYEIEKISFKGVKM